MHSVLGDDAPIVGATSICHDDEACLLLWHASRISVYATVLQQNSSDIAKELVRSPMCSIRLA